MKRRYGRRAGLLFVALLLLVGSPVGAPVAQAAPPTPAEIQGEQLFKQAIAHLANGKAAVKSVDNFFAEFEDVKMDWGESHHEGYLRLWFADPDKYRFESRPQRSSRDVTTKLLVGNRMWVSTPSGTRAMHKSAEGFGAIRQARKDRERVANLARFVTLAGLMGPGVKFVYAGRKRLSGPYAGDWLQVNRIENGSVIMFFFAHQTDAKGQTRATHPGVVTIVGNPDKGTPAEHFVLAKWRADGTSRFPGKIQAYAAKKGTPAPARVLQAFTRAIKINPGLDARHFQPPRH